MLSAIIPLVIAALIQQTVVAGESQSIVNPFAEGAPIADPNLLFPLILAGLVLKFWRF